MSILIELPKILADGKKEYEKLKRNPTENFSVAECYGDDMRSSLNDGVIAQGDNLKFMSSILNKESIDLIYVDPPFFSKADYGQEINIPADEGSQLHPIKVKVYKDTWSGGLEEYLRMITPRLFMMKDLLSESGSLWVHLDWHSSHYVKIILDEIFGEKNFLNEIIWTYKSGGASKNCFSRKHDTLLLYKKSKKHYFQPLKEKSYNRGLKPYRFKGVNEYEDNVGWHTIVNMKDVWQIDMVGRTSSERTGYATQKPEALLERIIESCTKEGEVCADFFGGSGTLAAVAYKMNRRFITCDKGSISAISIEKRLLKENAIFTMLVENAASHQGEIRISLNTIFSKEVRKAEVVLTSYKFEDNIRLPIDEKNNSLVEEMMNTNSLQFIDYWSIDTSYDGIIYKPKAFFTKEKNVLNTGYIFEYQDNTICEIAIRTVDIFGGISFNSFTLEEYLNEKN